MNDQTSPKDFRGDDYGYVAIVFAKGKQQAFTTDLHPTREAAAATAFQQAPALKRVMVETRYPGKPAGWDIRWIERYQLEESTCLS